MKISGNKTAILEILNLLDENFPNPFGCQKCRHIPYFIKNTDCNGLICTRYEDDNYPDNYVYDVDYDGLKIKNIRLIHKDRTNSNLLNGTVL